MNPEEIPDAAVEAFLAGEGVYRRESYRTGRWVAADGFRAGLAAALPHLPVPPERQREIEERAAREAWIWAAKAVESAAAAAYRRHPGAGAEYAKGWADAASVLRDAAEEMTARTEEVE